MNTSAYRTKSRRGQSVYAPGPGEENIESHTLAILVRNEPGVLARVIGLFSGRGYNIDSLSVAETDHAGHLSRITVVCSGTLAVIEQIKAQLERTVVVQEVKDLTVTGPYVDRELGLVRVVGQGEKRIEALQIAESFRARVVDSTLDSFIFEITGTAEKVNAFIDLMVPLGLAEVSRTGTAALARGGITERIKE
ncbi:MAG: acetolactate synthase small subunit [Alphaproteobacteria bacterium]|nr:acetolactate synthase small subunit [Alphaproteobacteria bacterium]